MFWAVITSSKKMMAAGTLQICLDVATALRRRGQRCVVVSL